MIFAEIINKSGNYIVGVIYRHPRGTEMVEFISHMSSLMKCIEKENKKVVIMGDFNVDLLNFESHSNTNSFLDTMLENFFQPHIIQPTRFSEKHKYTLIDNIFYNNITDQCMSGNLISHISDHLPNFLIIDDVNTCRLSNQKLSRDFSEFNINLFSEDLQNISFNEKLKNMPDTNIMYNFFHSALETLLDMHVPIKPIKKTKLKQKQKPWINDTVLNMIQEKNNLYSQFMARGDAHVLSKYKILRNNINHAIKNRKFLYYKNYFHEHRNNIKKFWSGINSFLARKNKSTFPTAITTTKGDTITDPKTIASAINSYFVNVAPDLVKKLPKSNSGKTFDNYLNNPNPSSFFLHPVTSKDVDAIITSL